MKVVSGSLSRQAATANDDDRLQIVRVRLALQSIPGSYQTDAAYHPPWPDPRFVRSVRAIVSQFRPDVVHAHGWSTFSALSVAPATAVVATLHDHGLSCPKRTLLRRDSVCVRGRGLACTSCDADTQSGPRRMALAAALCVTVPRLRRHVRRFLAVSRSVADHASQAGIPRHMIDVIPNFVDAPRERAIAQSSDEAVTFLFAGTASPHKGRQVLLEAFARLAPPSAVRLVLAGDHRPAINIARVRDAGRLEGEDLTDAYRRCSALVVPSIWAEPCPTVALEAMAAGKPVIASDIGGLTDIVEHGVCGLLVEPNDAPALAAALARFAADAPERTAMGRQARLRVRRFSSDVVVPQIEQVYAEVARGD